jgi:hypothetical protein
MNDEQIIGYEFNGIKFYKKTGKLESELGVSYLQSGDAAIFTDLIKRKTM